MWRRLAALVLVAACGDPDDVDPPGDGPTRCEPVPCAPAAVCRTGAMSCTGCVAMAPTPAMACGVAGACVDGVCVAPAGVEIDNPITGTGAFGAAVATNGRTVVGAFRDHRAYLIEPSGETFAIKQTFGSVFGEAGSQFGAAVAIDGDFIAIGAPRSTGPGAPADGAGAVILFERDPASDRWFESAQVVGPDGGDFGAAVALSPGRLFVGAPRSGGRGAVYIYERTAASTWALAERLDGAGSGDRYGHAIATQGERLVVGAPFGAAMPGSAEGYAVVYDHADTGWIEVARLRGAPGGSQFGAGVGVARDVVIVGAPGGTGVAHVFARGRGSWDELVTSLTSPDAAVTAFGAGVTTDGFRAAISQVDATGRGTTHVARLQPGGTWLFVGRIDDSAADQPGVDLGGIAVNAALSVTGTVAVVGYPGRDGGGAIVMRDLAGM